ncbi:MAG: 23S rRNA (pseudouridine(1915)-N(3))-methyltransferase RlmH [Burkholderiales bacterium]|jgi:23S rRNA (pseudouridine1915-N3)-methyltransferase|nr:23S rRNA (pseudouridine(1915)-N(3))-methyltransferase RlmH [Burkholderiales bacterium]
MKITIVAVGQRRPAWADAAVKDFLDRLPADWAVTVREVKAEARDGKLRERLMAAEADRLRAACPAGAVVVALDERGKDWTTMQLAQALQGWRDEAQPVAFVIGGPDGLDDALKRNARVLLRLSSLTLPHALARVLLAEQIYRAWSVLANHPYHRA